MIQIELLHMALYAEQDNRMTVLFPKTGHTLYLDPDGAKTPLSGEFRIEVYDSKKKRLRPTDTTWYRNGRIPKLNDALDSGLLDRKKAAKADDALADGSASAVLRLNGGILIAEPGRARCPADQIYIDAEWTIGETKSYLTNRIRYLIPTQPGLRYALENGTGTTIRELGDETSLIIGNLDEDMEDCPSIKTIELGPGKTFTKELEDFQTLYQLLKGKPKGQNPKVEIEGQAVIQTPQRPLCPVGEP